MLATPDAKVLNACRTLFGTEAAASLEFLLSLKPNALETAFRKKAKETHPDLFTAHDPHVQKRQVEQFRVMNDAYDIMRNYCERRDRAGKGSGLLPPVRRADTVKDAGHRQAGSNPECE